MKLKTLLIAIAAAALALPAVAAAHVTVAPESAPTDSYAHLDFSVPHACDGSPTTQIIVRIPENVVSVTPQRNPFWTLRTKEGPKEPTELHGETVTEGVSEVIWTAREPLPDHVLDVLGMSVKLPDAEGETIWFPVIQKCKKGRTDWIQVPAEGEDAHELDEPAPGVTLTAAEDGGHGAEPTAHEEEAAGDDGGSDGAPKSLAIAALVVGALGLITGGAGLMWNGNGRKS
ncbi:MAG TPA: YcnI family protein [Solirubrobacterales bacterium]|jgi:uncharacterized protein YcnI